MSYLSQMLGLTFHQFLSAATGIALAIAVIRGVARHSAKTIGNFYVDIVRCTLYVLIPSRWSPPSSWSRAAPSRT